MAIRSEQSKERYMNNIKCVVPSSTLNELNKILTNYDDDVFLNINDKKFVANIGRTQLVSSLLQGQFIDYGNVEENININLSGEDLDISFNSRYVIDALKVIEDEKVILEFNSSNSPCLIKPVSSNKFTYLIMPVRISN